MSGHAHWVNHLALNSDAILRTGACDPVERAKQRGAETADEQLKREFEEDSVRSHKRTCFRQQVETTRLPMVYSLFNL